MNTTDFLTVASAFKYDAKTGQIFWLASKQKVTAGKVAGTVSRQGYVRVVFQRKAYAAHRLAWLLSYGDWPAYDIDHINGNRSDNRLANLREVTRGVNMQNQKSARSNNKSSALLGVSFIKSRNKFRARITTDGKSKYLGLFPTADMAHDCYVAAKRELHLGCTI